MADKLSTMLSGPADPSDQVDARLAAFKYHVLRDEAKAAEGMKAVEYSWLTLCLHHEIRLWIGNRVKNGTPLMKLLYSNVTEYVDKMKESD